MTPFARPRKVVVNAAFGAAHRDHGDRFEEAYRDLTSMDPRNPVARSVVQAIYHDDDPGAALMEWHTHRANSAVAGGGYRGGHGNPGLGLPSLNSQGGGGGRSSWPVGEDREWSTTRNEEQTIFDAATR
jgi:hypothetical protein